MIGALTLLTVIAWPAFRATVGRTTPTATQLRISANITFADITLNQTVYHHVRLPFSVTPHAGDNVVELSGPTFNPQRCVFAWPQPTIPPGPYESTQNSLCQSDLFGKDLIFLVTSIDLTPASEAAYNIAIDRVLTTTCPAATLTVATGDYYGAALDPQTQFLRINRATGPLTATMKYTGTWGSVEFGKAVPMPTPDAEVWYFLLEISMRWTFHDASGALVGAVTFPYAGSLPIIFQIATTSGQTTYTTLSQQSPSSPTVCWNSLGAHLIYDAVPNMRFVPFVQNAPLAATPGDSVITVSPANTPTAIAQAPRFLVRFGACLALNDAAHALAPDLPRAPPDEIQDAALGTNSGG